MLYFFIGLFVIVIVFISCSTGKKRVPSDHTQKRQYCKLSSTKDRQSPRKSSHRSSISNEAPSAKAIEYFENCIRRFSEKQLAYCILSIAEKKGLSASCRIKLTEKYGLETLKPDLLSEMGDIDESGLKNSDVENASHAWLYQNIAHPASDSLEEIERFLLEKNMKKAEAIVVSTIA